MGNGVWASLATAIVVMTVLPVGHASPAALDSQIVTVPPSIDAAHASVGTRGGYLVGVVVADVEGTLTLANADITAHDVVADADGPAGKPWCARFRDRPCPLFASPLVGLGGQAAVAGTDELVPLATYTFSCSIHSWMTGTLVAI